MASTTVNQTPFPSGASVSIYTRDGSRAPLDTPVVPGQTLVTTATAGSGGALALTGLTEAAKYWAVGQDSTGSWRWVAFRVDEVIDAQITAQPAGQMRRQKVEQLVSATQLDMVSKSTTSAQAISSKLTIGAPVGLALALDGNVDAQNGAVSGLALSRAAFGLGATNGVNGPRGGAGGSHNNYVSTDVDANADKANGTDFSYFMGWNLNFTFRTKGSMQMYNAFLLNDEEQDGTPNVYNEAFGYYIGGTGNRVGALNGAAEFSWTQNANKPARASAMNFIFNENNTAAEYTAAVGANSIWSVGSPVIDVVSAGTQPVAYGIRYRGAFTRPIHYADLSGNRFAVGSVGQINVSRSTGTGDALQFFTREGQGNAGGTITPLAPLSPTFGITAEGKMRWAAAATNPTGAADVTLERSAVGQLKITGQLVITSTANIQGALDHDGTTVGFFGATPVTQRTGWGAPTGTATRTAFDTTTVTLPVLAEHVKALIDDFRTGGGYALLAA